MELTVTVLHNHSPDTFFRYHPTTSALFHAQDFVITADAVLEAADIAWVLANVDGPADLGTTKLDLVRYAPQVESYRRRRNRSLSVGDVLLFHEEGNLLGVMAVATLGWQELEFMPRFQAGTNATRVSESCRSLTADPQSL